MWCPCCKTSVFEDCGSKHLFGPKKLKFVSCRPGKNVKFPGTLTSEMHFVKFHPEVASCLLSRVKRKYAPLGLRLLWKYINYFLVNHLTSHFLLYLQNYNEFEAGILDLQLEKYGLSFDIKIYTTSCWALGDENVIGIRSFKFPGNLGQIFNKNS